MFHHKYKICQILYKATKKQVINQLASNAANCNLKNDDSHQTSIDSSHYGYDYKELQ